MSKSKHTPGTWLWNGEGNVTVGGCDLIATCGPERLECDRYRPAAEQRANAQLIAAAPELLYALRGMIDVVNQTSSARERVTAKRRARRAIAKAITG